jgi:hypothetical protein
MAKTTGSLFVISALVICLAIPHDRRQLGIITDNAPEPWISAQNYLTKLT